MCMFICIKQRKTSLFLFMKRIETSTEETDRLSALLKYQLIKNLILNLKKKITKNSMMQLSINFAKRSED